MVSGSLRQIIHHGSADSISSSGSRDSFPKSEGHQAKQIELPIILDDGDNDDVCEFCGSICPCSCQCHCFKCKRCKFPWVFFRQFIYYFILNAICLLIFQSILYHGKLQHEQNPNEPTFKKSAFRYYIGPGLAIVPGQVDIGEMGEPTVFYSTQGADTKTNRRETRYVEYISELLKHQRTTCKKTVNCPLMSENSYYGPCSESDYGYSDMNPCFYLKLNRLLNWMPEEYHKKRKISSNVPENLRAGIDPTRQVIYANCKGATKYDEDLYDDLKYYPDQFFEEDWFPMEPVKSNPMIAIQVIGLKPGRVLQMACGLYALNVRNDDAAKIFIYISPTV